MPTTVDQHIKTGVDCCLKAFLNDDSIQEKEMPNSLSSSERAYVHETARKLELLSKSRGKGVNRAVTVYKKGSLNFLKNDAKLTLSQTSKQLALAAMSQHQMTRQEKEMISNMDRERPRVERAMGRLAPGLPQVPCKTTLNFEVPENVLASLRKHMAVSIFRCGSDAKNRLLFISQILLNDFAERSAKVKIICSLKAGLQPRDFAESLADERNEKMSTSVGYQDKLESQVGPMSVLTFCHHEILLRSLMGNDAVLSGITHIIIDGVDENDRFCDLLLLILRDALNTRQKILKLILLTTTESPVTYKTYFPQFNPIPLNESSQSDNLMEAMLKNNENDVNFMVLCLYAKLLASPGFPIADFLARISNPPTFQTTRTNVQLLKAMEALNNLEEITELGNHLLDLPVEPKLGKMIIYAACLKCLDPVLTIVACLAYRGDIFIGSKEDIKRSKLELEESSESDHMTLLRAFQGWQAAHLDSEADIFCTRYNLSNEALESITNARAVILGHLRASGFVRAKGPGDIKDLNINAGNWALIKAALTAGLYPNVAAKLDEANAQNVYATKSGKVELLEDSVVGHSESHEWLIFDEISDHNEIAGVTVVTPITVFLFTGHNRLPNEFLVESIQGTNVSSEEFSDSENDDVDEVNNSVMKIDDWISFKSESESIQSLIHLRQKWSALFLRKLKNPGKTYTPADESILRAIVNILSEEEQNCGFSQPHGIGQRPKQIQC